MAHEQQCQGNVFESSCKLVAQEGGHVASATGHNQT